MNEPNSHNRRKGWIAAAAALAVLGLAAGWRVSSQEGPGDQSVSAGESARPDDAQSLEQLRAAAEAAPDDSEAWQQLAFAYFSRNMFAEAAQAYERAASLMPNSALLWSALGEARVMASEDEPIPAAALDAFKRAAAIDPGDPRARYFLAVDKDLGGDHEGAIADWLALLADTPPGSPWETDLVRTIEQVAQINDIAVGARIEQASATRDILPAPAMQGIPGPTQQQMAAAARLSPAQQQDMAEDMVARLAARLEAEPGDVEGWIMLMRSYATLERPEQGRAALREALDANPQASNVLREAASSFGL